MTRKINFVLCILIVLVFLFQTFMMARDYFIYMDQPTKLEAVKYGKQPTPKPTSILGFVWTEWVDKSDMDMYLTEGLAKAGEIDPNHPELTNEEQLGEKSNKYVMGLVGITVLGAVVAVMTIFTRKSLVQYIFSLAYAACGIYACFGDNYVLQHMGNHANAASILLSLKIASIAACVLVLARAYPWFYTRFIHKETIDLEALNA